MLSSFEFTRTFFFSFLLNTRTNNFEGSDSYSYEKYIFAGAYTWNDRNFRLRRSAQKLPCKHKIQFDFIYSRAYIRTCVCKMMPSQNNIDECRNTLIYTDTDIHREETKNTTRAQESEKLMHSDISSQYDRSELARSAFPPKLAATLIALGMTGGQRWDSNTQLQNLFDHLFPLPPALSGANINSLAFRLSSRMSSCDLAFLYVATVSLESNVGEAVNMCLHQCY